MQKAKRNWDSRGVNQEKVRALYEELMKDPKKEAEKGK